MNVFAIVVVMIIFTTGASADEGRTDYAPVGSRAGTVETIAGPKYCFAGPTTVDRDAPVLGALAVDANGRIFLDTGQPDSGLIAKVDASGVDSRVVATGAAIRPDMSPTAQELEMPAASRLAADGEGAVFVAAGAKILRVDPGKTVADPRVPAEQSVTTIAGKATRSPQVVGERSAGDGGQAEEAVFTSARSVATDDDGNLYITDTLEPEKGTVSVRVVNRGSEAMMFYPGTPQEVTIAPGAIDTIAGIVGAPDSLGDQGPARASILAGSPPAMAVAGNRLYLGLHRTGDGAEQARARVRMINLGGDPVTAHGVRLAPGHIDTVAGGAASGYRDGGSAREAAFGYVPGLAADGEDLYLADHDHHRIRRIDAQGTVTTIAGTGETAKARGGFNGNDQPAADARLNKPFDVAVGPHGTIYIADRGNGQLRAIDSSGRITLARGNHSRWWRCGSPSDHADLDGPAPPQTARPTRIAITTGGATYLLVEPNQRIMRRTPRGDALKALATHLEDAGCPERKDCQAPANLPSPTALRGVHDLAATPDGGLYLLRGDGAIDLVNTGPGPLRAHDHTVEPGRSTTIASTVHARGNRQAMDGSTPPADDSSTPSPDDGDAARRRLAVDDSGHVFISEFAIGQVRHVAPNGDVRVVSPSTEESPCCAQPVDVAVDHRGNLYIQDKATAQTWVFNRASEPVSVHGVTIPAKDLKPVAGNGTYAIGPDEGAPALDVSLPPVQTIAVSDDGMLYIAGPRHSIHAIDEGGALHTVAGTGRQGFNGDGLPPKLTSLRHPTDLAVDDCGNLLVADSDNMRVRRVNLTAPCEHSAPASTSDSTSWLGPVSLPLAGLVAAGITAITLGVWLAYRRRASRDSWARPAGHTSPPQPAHEEGLSP